MKRRNIIYEGMKFNQRIKQVGESVESFVIDLYVLLNTCNYGELTNEMIRDGIVISIHNDTVVEHLQIDPNLTLDKATVRIEQQEVASVENVDAKKRPHTKKILIQF